VNPIVDGIVLVLFLLFMVFIFGGYHKNKSAAREEQFKKDELNQKKEKEES